MMTNIGGDAEAEAQVSQDTKGVKKGLRRNEVKPSWKCGNDDDFQSDLSSVSGRPETQMKFPINKEH